MGTPFLSEIKIISWNYSPKGWAFCNGQLLPINQNQALFSLLGTVYGGDGRVNFALPDLRGRTPIHMGAGFTQGQKAGEEAHTVIISEMPAHNHFMQATSLTANTSPPTPVGNILGATNPAQGYAAFTAPTTLNPASVTNVGGSQAHTNLQPYLVLNFIIALQGAFPSQN